MTRAANDFIMIAEGGMKMRFYDGRDDKKVFPTARTLTVVSSNRIKCTQNDHMTIRKNGRVDWSLFYCERGSICFEKVTLQAGQILIYPPYVAQKYTTYKKDATVYRYLHFTGADICSLLDSLGIDTMTAIDAKSSSVCAVFDNIQNSLIQGGALGELQSEYHALHLLSKLTACSAEKSDRHLLKRVTETMQHSFASPYDAREYADMVKVSISRFNHLFKTYVGVAPYSYYIGLRIFNACNLLEETRLSVKEIAEKSGYSDPMYFTQAFKKRTGLTPSAYRKINQPPQ